MESFRCLARSVTSFVCLLAASSLLRAAPWAVVADNPNSQISMLDFGTTPATVYGPFLNHQLGTYGGGLFDVAITPDGKNALIANFGDKAVYRVDISTPTNPVVTGCVSNSFFTEDIAITPDGRFALGTDSSIKPARLAIIELASFNTSLTYFVTSAVIANAVAIAPDNQTVIIADATGHQLVYGLLCPTGLVSESVVSTGDGRPVNIAIAPNGKTILTANFNTNTISVFQIAGPGIVVTGVTPTVRGLVPGLGSQSIAFSPQGNRAYVLQNTMGTNMLSWLQINGPGNVTLGGAGVAMLLSKAHEQLFGVDTLAVSPDGAWILAGNPSLVGDTTNMLAVVNSSTFAVMPLDSLLQIPVGVAFVPTSELAADLDGDGLADLVTVVGSRWYVWFSTAQYQTRFGPYDLGAGLPVTGDVDGDGLPDLMSVAGEDWYIWFSTSQYLVRGGPSDLGYAGLPAAGDVDGDGLADLMMVLGSKWHVWFSTSQYLVHGGPYDLGIPGLPATGDIDGDGLDDLISVVGPNWYVWFSASQYQVCGGPYDMGVRGTPAAADVDGDGLADLICVAGSKWYVWFSTTQYQGRFGPYPLVAP